MAQIQKIEAVNREGLHRGIQEIRKAETSGFIGREKELDYYANKILQKNLAVISGIAGVGKSSLAAFLAKRFVDPPKIFWHSFKAGENFDVLLWELAAFLAWHGNDDLREQMYTPRQGGGTSPLTDVLVDYMIQLLRTEKYLICLDDYQFAEGNPRFRNFVSNLLEQAEDRKLFLIITSRGLPEFVKDG